MDAPSEGTENVRRDRAWIEREYGREKWPSIEAIVSEAIAVEGENPDLARLLGRVVAAERHGPGPLADHEAVIGGTRAVMPRTAAFAAQQAVVVELLRERCTPETDLIVELGAGWGRNLMLAWLAGLPAGARYAAGEITAAGRRAAETAAKVEPRLSLEAFELDLAAPDLTAIRGRNAVLLSVHAIEQVAELPASLIGEMLAVAEHVEVFHFEPVGFQVAGDTPSSTAAYAELHDYNRNLLGILRQAEAEGRIELDSPRVDVVGVRPDNASAIVAWRTPGG